MSNTELGKVLAGRRAALRLSQFDLADMSGTNIRTIYQVENGIGNPSLNTLQKIIDILGMEISVVIKNVDV